MAFSAWTTSSLTDGSLAFSSIIDRGVAGPRARDETQAEVEGASDDSGARGDGEKRIWEFITRCMQQNPVAK